VSRPFFYRTPRTRALVSDRGGYRRMVKFLEKSLGPERPRIATGLNNLAVVTPSMGSYAEAWPVYERGSKSNRAHLRLNVGAHDGARTFRYFDKSEGFEAPLLNLITIQGTTSLN